MTVEISGGATALLALYLIARLWLDRCRNRHLDRVAMELRAAREILQCGSVGSINMEMVKPRGKQVWDAIQERFTNN